MAAWEKEQSNYEKQRKKTAAEEAAAIQQLINNQEAAAATNTQTQIDAVPEQYRNVERAVGARQIANERNLTERMARAGATGSGYSDTHQAMVNISAGNQYADIDLKKRTAIDNLTQTLVDLQSKLKQQETAQITDINRQASLDIANNRTSLYNNYLQTEAQKAEAVQRARIAQIQEDAKARVEKQKQNDKLVESQRQLILDYTGGKINREQYNAVAPSYGLNPDTSGMSTNSTGGGSIYENNTMSPELFGRNMGAQLTRKAMIDYEVVNEIISAYPNDPAKQEAAARSAGVYDAYNQAASVPAYQELNKPVRDFKSRQVR